MKRLLRVMAVLAFSLAAFAPLASATTTFNPAAQDQAQADAYKAWYDANAAKDYVKAMELAKAYLEKFPTGTNADYLKNKWLPQMRGFFFKQAADAKNVAEVIKIGKEVLASDPENLDYLSALVVQIRSNELFANPPNFSHAAEAADFAERVIRLIEGGKKPTGAGADFNPKLTIAFMQQTLAVIHENSKNIDKALGAYDKAAAADPSNAAYFFHCGRLHNTRYAAAAAKYDPAQKKAEDLQKRVQAIPEAERNAAEPKPEVKSLLAESKAAQDAEKALLAEVNSEADAVLTCWARFLGLTVEKNPWGDARKAVLQNFTDLYKYRHNNSTDGMDKLIDQHKPSAPSN